MMPGPPMPGPMLPCPLCGGWAQGARCMQCGRDPTASRRSCARCRRMTPIREAACMHCAHRESNDLLWKIPLWALLVIVLFTLSVALRLIH